MSDKFFPYALASNSKGEPVLTIDFNGRVNLNEENKEGIYDTLSSQNKLEGIDQIKTTDYLVVALAVRLKFLENTLLDVMNENRSLSNRISHLEPPIDIDEEHDA